VNSQYIYLMLYVPCIDNNQFIIIHQEMHRLVIGKYLLPVGH